MLSLFSSLRSAGSLPVEGHLPGFDGATGWLNSPPLTDADVQGKVVLVDFWTYTCINWLRTLAYVRAWAERYADQGLVVVGVHTPEFPFERDVDNVRRAAKDMRVDYPIALDSDYAIWQAFANHYWPAVYIADAEGRIRHHHFGEGGYAECEMVIQRLLREAGRDGIPDDVVVRRARRGSRPRPTGRTWSRPRATSATSRAGASPHRSAPRSTSLARTRRRTRSGSTSGRSPASGRSNGVPACSTARRTDRVPLPRPRRPPRHGPAHARQLRCRSACSSTASRPARRTGSTSTSRARARSVEQRLYQLIRQRGPIADRTFEIVFAEPGVEAFVFTFG